MIQVFPLAKVSTAAQVTVVILTAGFAALTVIGYNTMPPSIRLIFSLVMILPLVIMLKLAFRMNSIRIVVDGGEVQVQGDFFSRRLPRGEIVKSGLQSVGGEAYRSVEPVMKTGGTSLPGYYTGWFRLRSGEKAFLAVSDKTKAVYVPTTLGYSLLLTPDDPDAFIAALRN